MNYFFKIFTLILVVITSGQTKIYAQELNCQVSVNHSQIQLSDVSVFETLQKAVYEFMNDTRWTDKVMKQEEKIECSIFITISSYANDKFTGSIQVQSRRPIFNTSYNSVMLNYVDNNFSFEYVENTALEFQSNTYISNLTSVLGFYAYVIIGLDFDSFSDHGGTQFFNTAQSIVNAAQNSGMPGWKSYEDSKNRYWLVENLLNGSYDDFRTFMYKYHRLGLDLFYEKSTTVRASMISDFTLLQNVQKAKPGLFILSIFVDAKRDELIGLLSQATPTEKQKAVSILSLIDPSHTSDYQKAGTQQ